MIDLSLIDRKAYGFDYDSNMLFTNSVIYLLLKEWGNWKPITVSQKDFDTINVDNILYRYVNDNVHESTREFREPGKYMETLIDALDNNRFWPSWEKFEIATCAANPLLKSTARGQSPLELREGHKFIIMEHLTQWQREQLVENMLCKLHDPLLYDAAQEKIIDLYLDGNQYFSVNSSEFLAQFPEAKELNVAQRKNIWFSYFVWYVQKKLATYYPEIAGPGMNFSIWFSDDNLRNIQSLEQHIEQKLLYTFPFTKFVLYNTANPHCIKKIELINPESGLH